MTDQKGSNSETISETSTDMSSKHLSDTAFSSLPLHEDLMKGIQETGFEFCTPIQALTLPVALKGSDVTGQAQTGTGKTAAFLIATIQRLLDNPIESSLEEAEKADGDADEKKTDDKPKAKSKIAHPRSIIIAPTRELAIQIHEDAKPLLSATKLKLALAYGGTDYDKQRESIEKGCDILVGTPGRIIDYFKQKVFSLNSIQVLVLDEADRMFDMGFIKDIRFLLTRMPEPKDRLNLLFSATLSERVKELAYVHMSDPVELKVESENVTADKIEQLGYMPSNEEKIPLLMGILRAHEDAKSVVFINTKYKGEQIQNWLNANDFSAGLLSGDVQQRKRETLLKKFKSGEIKTLVATDVAARGLHIDGVSLVVNFDLPTDAEDYVHRIGRTARAGASGKAINLVCETYGIHMMDVEEYIGKKIQIERDISDLLVTDAIKPKPIKKREPQNKRRPNQKAGKPSDSKRSNFKDNKGSNNNKPSRPSKPQNSNDAPQKQASSGVTNLIRRRKNTREIPAIG